MAKHTIKGFLTHTKSPYDKKPEISFSTYRPSAEYFPHTVVIREHSFEADVADDFDPRPVMVATLEEKKRLVRAEFAKTVKDLDAQIASLLAIENGAAS